jgi:hypothetical protein
VNIDEAPGESTGSDLTEQALRDIRALKAVRSAHCVRL